MNLLQKLLKFPIARHLSILVAGTIVAQGIMFVFQIFLRRIFSPEEFGAFAVYMSLLGILATVSSLRFEQAIILPKEESKGNHLLGLSLLISLFFSICVTISMLLFNQKIVHLTGFPEKYSHWFIGLPISLLLFGIYQALNYYLIRQKWFTISSKNKVTRRLTEGTTQTLLGIIKLPWGLIIGDWIGQFTNIIHAGYRIFNQKKIIHFFSIGGLKEVAILYRNFPLKNGIPSLFNALSLLLPVIFINRFTDAQQTGYFDLARMVLILPLSLITTSLSQVLLQRFSEKRNLQQSVKKEAIGVFLSLTLLSLLFGVVIQLFGEFLFGFVFGKGWETSGIYARILIWAFALKFIVSPFNILFTAFEKIGVISIWQLLYFVGIISLLWIPYQGIVGFLKAYVFIEIVSYTLAGILNIWLIYRYENNLNIKK